MGFIAPESEFPEGEERETLNPLLELGGLLISFTSYWCCFCLPNKGSSKSSLWIRQ